MEESRWQTDPTGNTAERTAPPQAVPSESCVDSAGIPSAKRPLSLYILNEIQNNNQDNVDNDNYGDLFNNRTQPRSPLPRTPHLAPQQFRKLRKISDLEPVIEPEPTETEFPCDRVDYPCFDPDPDINLDTIEPIVAEKSSEQNAKQNAEIIGDVRVPATIQPGEQIETHNETHNEVHDEVQKEIAEETPESFESPESFAVEDTGAEFEPEAEPETVMFEPIIPDPEMYEPILPESALLLPAETTLPEFMPSVVLEMSSDTVVLQSDTILSSDETLPPNETRDSNITSATPELYLPSDRPHIDPPVSEQPVAERSVVERLVPLESASVRPIAAGIPITPTILVTASKEGPVFDDEPSKYKIFKRFVTLAQREYPVSHGE